MAVSYLFYDWLCLYRGGESSDVNLQEFCTWAENYTDKPCTIHQVSAALAELEGYGLIEVESLRIRPNEINLGKFYSEANLDTDT